MISRDMVDIHSLRMHRKAIGTRHRHIRLGSPLHHSGKVGGSCLPHYQNINRGGRCGRGRIGPRFRADSDGKVRAGLCSLTAGNLHSSVLNGEKI